jgi:ubiquinone/menaquinone biosynthesis C-methylase UbiE
MYRERYSFHQVISKLPKIRWDSRVDDRPSTNSPRIKFSQMFTEEHLRKSKNMLDLGCGTGSYTYIVDRKGCVGVDLHINAIRVAKKYCKNSEFIVSSALSLPFRDRTFDVIFMWEVFEEIPVQAEIQAIHEINRVLLKNGVFFISFSNDHLLSNILDPAFVFRRFRHYNTDKFLKLISEAGLSTISYTIRGSIYTLISNFLVFFYKHILHHKGGKMKQFFDSKSAEELTKKKEGIVYTFIAAKKEN